MNVRIGSNWGKSKGAVWWCLIKLTKGPFKYYVIKEVGGWGQKMAIFDEKIYSTVMGLKKSKT